MRLSPPLAAAALALLAGCANAPKQPPIRLLAAGSERGCRFEAEGRVLADGSLAEAEAMLAQAARRWKGRSVIVLGGVEIPFKCFGMAISVLQRELEDGRIGFVAEPPPERLSEGPLSLDRHCRHRRRRPRWGSQAIPSSSPSISGR